MGFGIYNVWPEWFNRLARRLRGPRCPTCGQAGYVSERVVRTTFPYGAGDDVVELEVDLIVLRCAPCSEEWTDHRGEAQRERRVREHLAQKRSGA